MVAMLPGRCFRLHLGDGTTAIVRRQLRGVAKDAHQGQDHPLHAVDVVIVQDDLIGAFVPGGRPGGWMHRRAGVSHGVSARIAFMGSG